MNFKPLRNLGVTASSLSVKDLLFLGTDAKLTAIYYLKTMKPFNIRIRYGSEEITLAVIPVENGDFRIVYYNTILAGMKKNNNEWCLLTPEEVAGGDFPLYEPKIGEDRIIIDLTDQFTERIAEEIDLYLEDPS